MQGYIEATTSYVVLYTSFTLFSVLETTIVWLRGGAGWSTPWCHSVDIELQGHLTLTNLLSSYYTYVIGLS